MVDEQESLTGPDEEARKWAMLCHLAALVGLLGNGIGFLLRPLAVWLVKRDGEVYRYPMTIRFIK